MTDEINPGEIFGDNIEIVTKKIQINWRLVLLIIGISVIAFAIGAMAMKYRCDSVIEYYQALNASCLMFK